MRVLHVVPSYIPAWRYGGPIRTVHGICAGLARRGIEVHVYTTNVDGDRDSDVPLGRPVDLDGVRVTYFPTGLLRRIYRSGPMAVAMRREMKRFDLAHLHSVFLWPTWAAARRAEAAGVPYVVSPKGMLVADLIRRKSRWLKTAWIRLFDRRTMERAAGIQMTSRVEADELKGMGFRTVDPVVIHHGVDLPDVLPETKEPGPTAGKPARVVFLGRINWEKGLDRLIRAMRHLPDAELTLAGNDEEDFTPRLTELARGEGVLDRIAFRGPVKDAAKWEYLAGADLVVLPSYSESFGMVVLEAMALGRPVVVTPEVGLSTVVADTDSGIVVDGAPDKLGPAMQRFLADPASLRTKGENGRRVVQERFTWDSIAGQMQAMYDEILRRP